MKIRAVRTSLYDIPPEVERVDAIQAFVSMEFPFIEIEDADGVVGLSLIHISEPTRPY